MEHYLSPHMTVEELNQMTALALAHCGDGVFELLVRTWLCTHGRVKSGQLHRETIALVCAEAQAKRAEALLPLLNEQETGWYRRGRNCRVHSVPKHTDAVVYSKATGVEALFGALYLSGQRDRANELFCATMEEEHGL